MWMDDIRKALFVLSSKGLNYSMLIDRIENDTIYTTSGKQFSITELSKQYDTLY